MKRPRILLSLLVALCAVHSATSLWCFSCDQLDSDDVCEENFIECDVSSAGAGMLRIAALKPTIQIIQSTSFNCFKMIIDNPSDRRYRALGCSYDSVDVCQGEPRIGVQTECRWCNDRDGCNSANHFKASSMLIVGLMMIGLLKKY